MRKAIYVGLSGWKSTGMFTSITVGRLYIGSVYKLIGIGLTCSIVPLTLLAGIVALFGVSTVTWNAKPISGAWGLALYPVFAVLLVIGMTFVTGTACIAGLWLYSKFRPLVLWGRNVLVQTPGRTAWPQALADT
jgi:hypothetical protein